MDPTPQKPSSPASFSIPGYTIERELGHGGMAHVYLAIQESFGREVALKVLSPHLADDDQFSKRFLREARIVSQLNHPNIVTVYDAGKQGKFHYMSMEYIPGKDLKQLKDSISRQEAIRIVKDVARALDFAGNKGVVHRDVKPENIMIHATDKRVVLMDFGIAHGDDVTHGMTQTGKAIGTPHFMSPEQTKGLKVDHRSDIYSLGIVLFQLLAGYLPYDASSAVAVGIKHLTAPIPVLPAGLEIFQPIVNICLSKQPSHRYQKASELIAALDKITDAQLANINTQATVFKQAGADHNAETQISGSIQTKQRIPDLVFPSHTNKTVDEDNIEYNKTGNRRRNLLIILLLCTIAWAANDKKQELIHFWGLTALPELAKKLPGAFPDSYLNYWAEKLTPKKTTEVIKPEETKLSATNEAPTNTAAAESQANIQNKTAETETAPVQATKPELSAEEKIALLKSELSNKPENAIELTAIYKEMLSQSLQDPVARQGIKELREWYIEKIQLAFASEDTILARQYIQIMKQSFPRATQNKRFTRLEEKISFMEKIQSHLAQADKYFNAGALSKPVNKNALAEINIVLQLSPENQDAKKFLEKIAASYLDKTEQLQQQGNLQNALLMIEEGIAVLINNSLLIEKRKELKDIISHNKNITALFKQARKYQAAGNLIEPQGYNAFDFYQKILEKEKDNLQAKAEIKVIHQKLAENIINYIRQDDLTKAEEIFNAAIQRYGRTPLLANAQLKLNDAIAARAPKIETIMLSHSPVKAVSTPQSLDAEVLQLNNTLYIGFNYINFDPGSTWLEADLYANNGNTLIAQKPVVISKQFGEHFFDITLQARTFTAGQYKITLKIKDKILQSKTFKVRR
ncbi:MAG: serine/threonine protein kinase [Gammaproteobacteria bacterium]|nr:serine/threonine protein kinase [Gammaproteobacteria bacterium]